MMGETTLYDDDILLWSEQQAAALRRLRDMPTLPADLDIEHVAEEIERVGRSELTAVRVGLRSLIVHLVKLAAERDVEAAARRRGEIAGVRDELADRYTSSMLKRIAMDDVWRAVRDRLRVNRTMTAEAIDSLPGVCPFALADLVDGDVGVDVLADRLKIAAPFKGNG